MTPELLTAYASIGTFIVIAITAIAALVQLRHIRSANQLAGMMEYIKIWQTEAMQHANLFIQEQLVTKLQDPQYRQELFEQHVDRTLHPELAVADWCEQAGSYIKYGLLASAQFLDLGGGFVGLMWGQLKEVVAIRRTATGNGAMYENFEYLAALQQQWERDHRQGNYPRGLPRLLTQQECEQLARSTWRSTSQ